MTNLEKQFQAVDRPKNIVLFVSLAVFLALALLYEGSWLKETVGLWGDAIGVLPLVGVLVWLVISTYREKKELARAHGLICGHCGKTPQPWFALVTDQTRICPYCRKQIHRMHPPLVSGTLRDFVLHLVKNPTLENRQAFYRTLRSSEVAVPMESLPGGIQPDQVVITKGGFHVPNTRGPDGLLFLLVYTDQEAALQVPQAKTGFWLSARIVLEMAAANQAGVHVSTGFGPTNVWVRVAQEEVASILSLAKLRAESDAKRSFAK